MAKTLVPTEFKTHIIDQLIESIDEQSNTVYYAFVGDHISEGATVDEITQPVQNYNAVQVDSFRNMIFGKRLAVGDIKFMINRYDWEANTVFEMYDDRTTDLLDKKFYTVVDENAYKHVYKCLYNADGAPSTSKPLFKDAKYDSELYVEGDGYYETTDGYQWKYLYSIDSKTFDKFSTQKYIPVTANTTVEENAKPGSIDVIRVATEGKNYNNSFSGQFLAEDLNRITPTIAAGAIPPLADPQLWYRLREASQVTNFYANTVISLTAGTGSGEFQRVVQSRYVTGVGTVIKVAEQFEVIPDDTTTFRIDPEVRITGNGNESSRALARAVIDPTSSNSVLKIDMLDTGRDYTYATAEVLAGAPADENLEQNGVLIETIPASIVPIISPQGGHGANTAIELGAKRAAMYMLFEKDENDLVPAENTFGQFGILRDPKFANTQLYYENVSGQFVDGEEIDQIVFSELQGSFVANTGILSKFVQRDDSLSDHYDTFLEVGDKIYITDEQTGAAFYTEVAVGSNTTAISLKDEISFLEAGSNFDVQVYLAKTIASAKISNINPPLASTPAAAILVNEADPNFVIGEIIYGRTSKTVATVSGIDINNRINDINATFNFSNFNQMLKIQGTTADMFQADETVTQISTQENANPATAKLHSYTSNKLNLTRVEGDFESGGNEITGNSSDGVFESVPGDTLDITYGDLDPNYGAIIYLQNDIPVTREGNQTEEIRVILEF